MSHCRKIPFVACYMRAREGFALPDCTLPEGRGTSLNRIFPKTCPTRLALMVSGSRPFSWVWARSLTIVVMSAVKNRISASSGLPMLMGLTGFMGFMGVGGLRGDGAFLEALGCIVAWCAEASGLPRSFPCCCGPRCFRKGERHGQPINVDRKFHACIRCLYRHEARTI
jgi:hypothetical protein